MWCSSAGILSWLASRLIRVESERAEWVPLASVVGLIAAGEIWNGGSVVGLLHVLAVRS